MSVSQRNRRAWEGIVAYANADLQGAKGIENGLETLLMLLHQFPEWRSEVALTKKLVIIYQRQLKSLLLWLCDPKSNPGLRIEVLKFLQASSQEQWRINWDEDPIEAIEKGEYPFMYFAKQVRYPTMMGPICKFILVQIDDPLGPLPIRFCKRSGCGKFFVPGRSDKQYCSDSCRAMDHPKEKSEMKDYQYLRRLEKLSEKPDEHGLVRQKLKNNEGRIAEIEARWQEWAPEKIRRIKKNVTR